MPFRAVFFDLDGTLLDSIDDIAGAMNFALQGEGLPVHDVKAYKYFVGNGMKMLVERSAPADASPGLKQRLLEVMQRQYALTWDHKTRPYGGINELLDALRQRELLLAVLSNKPHQATCGVVERFFPTKPFVMVQGSPSPQVPAKPQPGVALAMAEKLGLAPREILFMGDTKTDMETARNAEMIPVGVLWGFRTRDELVDNGAKYLLDKPLDLLPLLDATV